MNKLLIRFFITLFIVVNIQPIAVADFFSNTELQIHADFNRKPAENDILTTTIEHFSEWKYGDNFFFLDIEGKEDFAIEADTLYFEYAPRFSLDNLFDNKIIPNFGELYATVQYNDSDRDFINQVWLYGLSIDFVGQPNYGFSNLHLLVREENTQDTSYQITFAWGQPFRIGSWQFIFNGFADYWEDDDKTVFLAEPQLRLPLANFVGQDNLFAKAVIGTEFEISKDFFGKGYGWETNPTIFLSFPF